MQRGARPAEQADLAAEQLLLQNKNLLDEVLQLRAAVAQTPVEGEELAWRLKLQTKRASFLGLLGGAELHALAEEVLALPATELLCYCGGRFIERLGAVLPAAAQPPPAPVPVPSVEEGVVSGLRAHIVELLGVSEKRRVDRQTLGCLVLESDFFKKIWENNRALSLHVDELERRLEACGQAATEVAVLRRRELDDLRQSFETERACWAQPSVVFSPPGPSVPLSAVSTAAVVACTHDTEIVTLVAQLKIEQERASTLEAQLGEQRTQVLDLTECGALRELLNRKFRHRTHEELFAKLLAASPALEAPLRELERYVKSREERMAVAERGAKSAAEELASARKQLAAVLDQLGRAAERCTQVQVRLETLSRERDDAERGFAAILAERDKTTLELRGELATVRAQAEVRERDLHRREEHLHATRAGMADAHQLLRDEQIRIAQLSSLLREATQKTESLAGNQLTLSARNELLEKTLAANEASHLRLREEIASNLQTLAEKNATITHLLEGAAGGNSSLNRVQLEEYLQTQHQLVALKRQATCSVCEERPRNVVLDTCFHSFCDVCVENRFKNRSRNCPLCKASMGRDNVRRLYS